ncbi:MAG TPA: hypothetical protein DGG95_09805 [Cytophagales bacterium]|jgi:hypothetical protein|nr:hypothetical protein [Cytophagales bacterium]
MERFLKLIVFFIVALPLFAKAQSFYPVTNERKYILTGGTGSATYYGELSNPGTVIKYQPNLNVGIMKYFNENIWARAEMNWFMLQGSDVNANETGRKLRAMSFHSSCEELSVVGGINLYGTGRTYIRRPTINIYAFGGIGLLHFNPKADYKGKSYALEPLHTEGVSYSRVVPVIPYGLGFRLKTSPNVNIVIEAGYRKTFTDYLDDVSTKYIATSSSFSDAQNFFINPNPSNGFQAGSKRGDPSHTDSYFLLNAKVEYYLPFSGPDPYTSKGRIKKRTKFRYNKRGGIKRY